MTEVETSPEDSNGLGADGLGAAGELVAADEPEADADEPEADDESAADADEPEAAPAADGAPGIAAASESGSTKAKSQTSGGSSPKIVKAKPAVEPDAGRKAKVKAKSGRATPKGGPPPRAPKPGRYTPPIPREVRRSPAWFPYVLLSAMGAGLLVIVLDYMQVLPSSPNSWYLIAGIGAIVGGLIMATFYH